MHKVCEKKKYDFFSFNIKTEEIIKNECTVGWLIYFYSEKKINGQCSTHHSSHHFIDDSIF